MLITQNLDWFHQPGVPELINLKRQRQNRSKTLGGLVKDWRTGDSRMTTEIDHEIISNYEQLSEMVCMPQDLLSSGSRAPQSRAEKQDTPTADLLN